MTLPDFITLIFLLVIASYYFLLLYRPKKREHRDTFAGITIIIPAHNEELLLADAIESVLAASFHGRKEVIVVDDGSSDETYRVAQQFSKRGVNAIRTCHLGKSAAINAALKLADTELIAIVDADSIIGKNALRAMAQEVGKRGVAAATGVVRVRNRKAGICMWVHIEQLYNSLMRLILAKANANIATPGPLSMYRKAMLDEIGGFSTDGFSEDLDVTIRLIRKGHHIGFSQDSIAETVMPSDPKGFLRQRTRFARGMIHIFKRHLRFGMRAIDMYTLPIFLFTYIQAVIMGSFTLYQIISGYMSYFASQGVYFSSGVARFLFEWLSIVGFIRWAAGIFSGTAPLDAIAIAGILATLLSYPLYFLAIAMFDKKFDLRHAIPLFFMFPFWLLIMAIYILCTPELFSNKQYNRWKKNE